MESRTTAKYQVIQDAGGWRFRFYCDASGALGCATEVYRGERPEDALAAGPHLQILGIALIFICLMILTNAILQTYGKEKLPIFTVIACGRWVITAMYNVDSLQCVDCAPWTARIAFCPACGAKTRKDDAVCSACGADLRGEGGAADA